jgi:hypothetical protein
MLAILLSQVSLGTSQFSSLTGGSQANREVAGFEETRPLNSCEPNYGLARTVNASGASALDAVKEEGEI